VSNARKPQNLKIVRVVENAGLAVNVSNVRTVTNVATVPNVMIVRIVVYAVIV